MSSKQPATSKRQQSATGILKSAMPTRQAPARRRAAPRREAEVTPAAIGPEDRYRLIAEAAYHRAQKRGFAAGGEVQDWLEAEAEVDARLGKS